MILAKWTHWPSRMALLLGTDKTADWSKMSWAGLSWTHYQEINTFPILRPGWLGTTVL